MDRDGAPDHGFPPGKRLRKRPEFLRTRRLGHRLHGRRFVYYVRPASSGPTRIGITVSRKVGNAVVRNRIKRWVREAFRQQPELFPRPVDVVVIAKRDIEDFSYQAIRDELTDVFKRYFERDHAEDGRGAPRRGGRRRPRPRGGASRGDRPV